MNTSKSARIVGVLFLVQMFTAAISHMVFITPVLYKKDFLTAVASHSNQIINGMLLDLACGLSVFGIAVILYPLLKRFSEPIAVWYAGFRLFEWIMLIVSGVLLLTIITVSKDYVIATAPELIYLKKTGTYFREAREYSKILMLLGYCINAFLFYALLFKTKLLPRFISVWGLGALVLLFAEVISNIYGHSIGGIKIMLPMGLNELFLGVWLIIKGFNPSALVLNQTNQH